MATLYLDFENGNDNYAGTSFALLAQGTDGRITTATFSSATASFPNDGSLIGQYLSIFNGSIYAVYNITAWVSSTSLTIAAISGGTALANQAVDRQYYIGGRWKNITTGATAVRTIPGDTIRMMGSPAPTSLGQNGVWTSQALQTTKSITSSTNATPIAITITAHGYSTGDTVVIASHEINTNGNGTWVITVTGANTFTLNGSTGNAVGAATGTARLRNNTVVLLNSAVTQNVASTGPGRAAWTSAGGANVTTALDGATTKEHYQSDSFNIAAAFATGLAAYYATGTLDLSGYQQLSFWIRQNSGTIQTVATGLELRLCSDTAGVTAVNTFTIPVVNGAARWRPVTVDLGTNLGSSIRSIALYVTTDNGTLSFNLSNIIACKASSAADSLTLTSLIGKNTTGETFWGIQSINGTRVMLDADTQATPTNTNLRGYYGTSETVTTYKRETIKLGPAASSTTTLQTIQEDGTDGSPITYSGGWDRTNMSTQSLETWLDGVNGNGYGIATTSRSWIQLQRISGSRLNSLISLGNVSSFGSHTLGAITNCSGNSIDNSNASRFYSLEVDFIVAIAGTGFTKFAGPLNNGSIKINRGVLSCATSGLDIQNGKFNLTGVPSQTKIANNAGSAVSHANAELFISNVSTEENVSGGIASSQGAYVYLKNCVISESTEVSVISFSAFAVQSHNHDQVVGNHKIFGDGFLISAATDQRKTASGISWKIQPTSTTRSSAWPVTLSLAKVACSANNLVTIKAWMYRDNSGLTMRLVCKGGQIAGVASDVVSALSTTSAWEEETITFTPTETGVVEITAEAWGGTTFSGWVDDMTISQA